MNLKINDKELSNMITKFQEGGEMAAPAPEEAAPAEAAPAEGGEDALQQLAEVFMQGLQNQDCNLLAQGAQMFLQAIGGGGEPAPQAPEGSAPVYGKGGRFSRWTRK